MSDHRAPHPMERLAPVVADALAIIPSPPHDHQGQVNRAILLTLWRLAENVAIVTQWQHALHEQIDDFLENDMDVTGFAPIVSKLNDTATSLAASAQAISAGNSAAQADQQQLNAALASLSTAVDGVAAAAKAVSDAVSPAAQATPVTPEQPATPAPQQ